MVNRFKEIQDVTDALPMISVVGTVSFQNSVSDMAAYGVTADYLKNSAIRPVHGKVFDSNETVVEISHQSEDEELFSEETFSEEMDDEISVAGVQTDSSVQCAYGEELMDVEFSIHPGKWLRVRESAGTGSEIIGYTRRAEGIQTGTEVAGLKYASDDGRGSFGKDKDDTDLGKWISAKVPLWQKTSCDVEDDIDCAQGKFVVLRDEEGIQIQQNGFIAEVGLNVNGIDNELGAVSGNEEEPIVKGEKIAQTDFVDVSEIDWADLGTEIIGSSEEEEVEITSSTQKEAVVNRAMLKILNINENEAVGKTFKVSFSAIGALLENPEERIKSVPTDYKIVGVTPDEGSPLLYVPFIDLRSMGINNYSQVKMIANSKESLENIRKNVEAMGFVTSSVVDTVNQISDLFAKVRLVLVLVGMIALAVASLGMFNTLTVSLLERTREVGLMKAMGMKSVEVWELFLVESILMGFLGGILGIIIGFVAGKLLGVFLSFFSIFKGAGAVDVTYLPPFFVITVLVLSLIVGIGTGIYPAKRAKKISALDALRYE